MNQAPTYADMQRKQVEQQGLEARELQRMSTVNDANAMYRKNPVLEGYMQGLEPKQTDPASEYTMFATNVANSVPDQVAYSKSMVDLAVKGQINPEFVLGDDSVLPEFKQALIPRGL